MDKDVDRLISEAESRGKIVETAEPRADAATFDPGTGRVRVALSNGCYFEFPARSIQGLEEADDSVLADIAILGRGIGLHWEALDVDVSVPGFLSGLFGTKAWMDRQRAARAGSARSNTKADAARRNGMKGGRPRKIAL